jgi:asparagine synthase (glutamine-hydrolysing)
MCGIAGSVRSTVQASSMLPALGHRGPDRRGSVDLGACTLAMTRLAVLDTTSGADQPMHHRDATIVFNGEIYNFVDLRRELQSYGWDFQTTGDTEVLLKSLLHWREDALPRLRGMYAFLLWHGDSHELWAARDSFGIKPLYRAATPDGGMCFASEARALHEQLHAGISAKAVAEFLHFGSPYSVTAFDGVVELVPGTLLRLKADGGVDVKPVAMRDAPSVTLTETVDRVLKRHLVSDRPTALFLSGGFDSALVASATADAPNPPTAIVLDTGFNAADVAGARRTASHYGLDLEVIDWPIGADATVFAAYVRFMDQPTIDGLNTYLVADAANLAGFPVALCGLGGDELLGGYGYYRRAGGVAQVAKVYRRLPAPARRMLDRLLARQTSRTPAQARAVLEATSTAEQYQAWRCVFTRAEVEHLTGVMPEPAQPVIAKDERAQLAQLDFDLYLRSTLLRDSDVFSMACGVEIRVPLLDTDLVHHVQLLHPRPDKASLAASIGDDYLVALAAQPKHPFRLPWHTWVDRPTLTEQLSSGDPWRGLVDPVAAQAVLRSDGDAPIDRRLALTILARWLSAVDEARRIEPRPIVIGPTS